VEDEIWLPVPEWPEYEVSNLGRVRSLDRYVTQRKFDTTYTRLMRGRMLAQSLMSSGRYLFVTLGNQKKVERPSVHRLVTLTFHGPAPSKHHEAAHNDGDSFNNRESNLRWATPMENTQDKFLHGTIRRGEAHHSTRIPDSVVVQLIARRKETGLPYYKLAKEFGMCTMHAWRICNAIRRGSVLAGDLVGT